VPGAHYLRHLVCIRSTIQQEETHGNGPETDLRARIAGEQKAARSIR
jgi:hypothetical protein